MRPPASCVPAVWSREAGFYALETQGGVGQDSAVSLCWMGWFLAPALPLLNSVFVPGEEPLMTLTLLSSTSTLWEKGDGNVDFPLSSHRRQDPKLK